MSHELVELVRQAHDHFSRTGQPLWEMLDADVEVFDHDMPDASNPYRRQEGVVRWLSEFEQSWNRYVMELERVVDVGDRIVSLFRIRAVGAGSGVPVERGDAMVWWFRGTKLARLDYFNDQAQALAAVGIEQPA